MTDKEYQPFNHLIKGIPIKQATEIADYCLVLHSRVAKLEKALREIMSEETISLSDAVFIAKEALQEGEKG